MAVPAPGETLKIKSLGTEAKLMDRPIKFIQLLGGAKVDHKQDADALSIRCPGEMSFQHAVGFKIVFQQEQ